MKALFFFLLLANIVLALYVQVAEHRRPALDLAALQLHPEKMKIVAGAPSDESVTPAPAAAPAAAPGTPPVSAPPATTVPPAVSPAPSAVPATPPAAPQTSGRATPQATAQPVASAVMRPAVLCATLKGIAVADAAHAEAALAKLDLADGHVERRTAEADRYWVYIPPPATPAGVEAAGRMLKASGITDYFVVQDHTHWRNAISLGLFRTDDAATSFLADLQKKGVAGAIVTVRHDLGRQVVFTISALPEPLLPKLTALQQDFPGSSLSAGACSRSTAQAG